ncbi:MAG: metal ABC transporter permease [Pseudomonadota bacterium]
MAWDVVFAALTLQAGYNAAVVLIGATLLGLSAGACGPFLFLRKRAMVSDALAHATLPGVALAFMALVALGGDGRFLPALLVGSALSAGAGLLAIDWLTHRTRLTEDAAIGAVLSVFFGAGVVLLTLIQSMGAGRQAGLEDFLLGSAAGMLAADAVVIGVGAALCLSIVVTFRRPLTLVAFDPIFAATSGINVRAMDRLALALALGVTVVGLKLVGLVLIVALLIVPPVTARFWTDRTGVLIALSALFGAVSAAMGTALSAAAPGLPTGAIIVLTAFGLFLVSFTGSPLRGVLAAAIKHRRTAVRVHRRQGLLALAKGEPIYDRMTLSVLRREGLLRRDGVATPRGEAAAADARREEARWAIARAVFDADGRRDDGLTPIDAVLTADQIAVIDQRLNTLSAV